MRDGRIVSVGPADRASIPAGAERVSLAGKIVIPGLVNAHGHVGNTEGLEQGHYSAANVLRDLRTYAAYGVTTVFSLGDDQDAGIKARDAQNTRRSIARGCMSPARSSRRRRRRKRASSWTTMRR